MDMKLVFLDYLYIEVSLRLFHRFDERYIIVLIIDHANFEIWSKNIGREKTGSLYWEYNCGSYDAS